MNDEGGNGRNFRKIAIAFDPTFSTPALLEAAADLAVAFGAELEALFVEDTDIASLRGLPFARLFEPASGRSVRFDETTWAAKRAGPVARNRVALRRLSKTRRFTYTVREYAGHALTTAAEQSTAELIVIAAGQSKFGGAARIDEEAMKIAATAPRSVLVASHFPISVERVLLIAGDDAVGRRAAHAADLITQHGAGAGKTALEKLSPEGLTRDRLAERVKAFSPTLMIVGIADPVLVAAASGQLHPESCSMLVVR